MANTYTDQFFLLDPYAPPPAGRMLNFVSYTLTDQDGDGDIGAAGNDMVNGRDVTASYKGDTVTINVPGTGRVTYTGVTFYLAGGGRAFTPTDGKVLQNGTLVSTTWVTTQAPLLVSNLGPPCFAAGTLIDTDTGPRPIERIAVGDLVRTLDDGMQPVRWAGMRLVPGAGPLAPVRFAPRALGNRRALLVSPQHRILVTGWRAQLLCGCDEVLVAAVHMVDGATVARRPMRAVAYHHLLLDAHQVIFAEGAPCESLFAGAQVLSDPDLRTEIAALVPGILASPSDQVLARRVATAAEAAVLRGARTRAA